MEDEISELSATELISELSVPQKLFFVLLGFIFLALIFSLIYRISYHYNENSFFFNEQITHSRKLTILGELQTDLELRQRHSSSIRAFADAKDPKISSTNLVTNRTGIRDNASCVVNQDGESFKIFIISRSRGILPSATIQVQGSDSEITYTFDEMKLTNPFTASGINDFGSPVIYQMVASKIADLESQKAKRIEKKIERFAKKEEGKWGYFDFLYFSVTSTTGGGYGDVFPATTWTRTLVMVQMIVNLFFVGIAFNIIASSKNSKIEHKKIN